MFDYREPPVALACISGERGIHGKVKFFSHRDGVLVTADICGLPESETHFLAFHIHEGEDCWGAGFSNTGGHWNPGGEKHPNHAGDLPPLLVCRGKAYLAVVTNRFRIPEILGRTVVIHSGSDDFHTQPSGNAGTKIACGVIRKA